MALLKTVMMATPGYNKNDPQSYFTRLEVYFKSHGVTAQTDKYANLFVVPRSINRGESHHHIILERQAKRH